MESRAAWKDVGTLAEENNYILHLVSDKEYHKRQRPMPRGGVLYSMVNDLYVRYEQVSPDKVREFIEQHKAPELK